MPRQPKLSTRKQDQETEQRIQTACHELGIGEHKSIMQAARAHNNKYEAQAPRRLLTDTQEGVIVAWVGFLGTCGHGFNQRELRSRVSALCNKRPGKKWLRYFKARHPELKLGRGTGIDPKRAQAFNKSNVMSHFDLFERITQEFQIPLENIYNMDEKGLQLGGGRKGRREKYFFPRSERSQCQVRIQSSNLQLVTIIECVSARGALVDPGFVFAAQSGFCSEWFEGTEEKYHVALTENGWTTDYVCSEWFESTFVPCTKQANTSGKPILLLLDGHGSHLTDRMVELALSNNIHLYCLPPHTTHRLQPLDVGVFGPSQRCWEARCDEAVDMTGECIRIEDVVKEYLHVRRTSMKSETIIKAWKSCGLVPLNREVFDEAFYAPSYKTSTKPHAPSSFPVIMPQVPDMSSDDFEWDPTTATAVVDSDNDDEASETDQSDSGSSDLDSDLETSTPQDNAAETYNNNHPVTQAHEDFGRSSLSLEIGRGLNEQPGPSQRLHTHTRSVSASSASISVNGSTWKRKFEDLDDANTELCRLQKENWELRVQREAAETHCVFAMRENAVLKLQMNGKRKSRKRFRVGATCLTAGEGRLRWEEEKQMRNEKERLEALKKAEREKQAAEREAQRVVQAETGVFSGSLYSKNKPELLDIAAALQVTVLNLPKAGIIDQINMHMDEHTELQENERFKGLFASRTRANQRNRAPFISAGDEHTQIDSVELIIT